MLTTFEQIKTATSLTLLNGNPFVTLTEVTIPCPDSLKQKLLSTIDNLYETNSYFDNELYPARLTFKRGKVRLSYLTDMATVKSVVIH